MKNRLPRVGEVIKTYWSSPQGEQRAKVLCVFAYNGRYTQYFTHVIRLTSNTPRGWTEIAWNENKPKREWFLTKK